VLSGVWQLVDASKLWLLQKLNDLHWTLRYHLLDLFDERFFLVRYFYTCVIVAFCLFLLVWNPLSTVSYYWNSGRQNSVILHMQNLAQNWLSCGELTEWHRNFKILRILFSNIALGTDGCHSQHQAFWCKIDKILRDIAEIWRFFEFSKWRPPLSCIFQIRKF